jgi:hypothetical protein
MNCERCGEAMCEEELVVQGGLVKVKNMTAWHCEICGRIEYKGCLSHEDLFLIHRATPTPETLRHRF